MKCLVSFVVFAITASGLGLSPAAGADTLKRSKEAAAPDAPLNSISGWLHFSGAPESLYRHLTNEAYAQLDERNRRVRQIDSAAGWKTQQERVASTLSEIVGPFPERTPLNARIVRTIEKKEYTIEHIVFESQPGFHVTSSLFLPRNLSAKAPVVLYCSGHSDSGYRGGYTRIILNLVKKGFVVFAWDPIGQGERLQYLGDSGRSVVGVGTREHAYMTVQSMLTGSSLARHVIWDGIRAVDYIVSRPEVDPHRIAATGRSGGGFQSLYIPALEPRILATAPENHVTNSMRILQKIGPRDGEQNLFHMFARGIDHPDLLSVRAPKPTLVIATANDYFNIDGTRETVREVAAAYRALGSAEDLVLVEDIAGHGSTTLNNETMFGFFQKHLNNPGSPVTEDVEMPTNEEMKVTTTGQVVSTYQGETVASLSAREGEAMADRLKAAVQSGSLTAARVIERAKVQSGYRAPNLTDRPVLTGTQRREGYLVERYFVNGEGDYPVPYVVMVPARPNGKAVLYLHPAGKAAQGGKGGEIEAFVRQGYKVLAPDLIGTGEAGPGDSSTGEKDFFHRVNTGVSYRTWYVGMFIGRSILGVRAADVVKLAAILKTGGATEVIGVGRGAMGPVLLHAAAFTSDIARVGIIDAPGSYRSLVTTRMYAPQFIEAFVPAALRDYDLPHLAAALAPRRVLLHNVLDGAALRMSEAAAATEYASATAAYRSNDAASKLRLTVGDDTRQPLAELLRE